MSDQQILTCTLPNAQVLRTKRTGKFEKLLKLPDGALFCFENQIWEKLPGSCANLSDLDDGSEVIGYTKVELLEQI